MNEITLKTIRKKQTTRKEAVGIIYKPERLKTKLDGYKMM